MKPLSNKTIGRLVWAAAVIFAFSLALMLNSCKTSSKLQTTSHATTQNNVAASSEESHAQVQNQQTSTQQSTSQQNTQQADIDDQTEQHNIWYDTSKPVDPVTGKPPISHESTTTHKKIDKSKADQSKTDQSNIQDNKNNQVNDSKKSELKDKTKTTADQKAKSSYESKFSLPWWVYLVIGCIFTIIGYISFPQIRTFIKEKI